MSMDRSLKMSASLARNRSVLTRAERIAQLTDEGKFDKEKDSPFKLPKVKVHHSKAGAKAKKAAAAEGVEGAAGAEGAPAAGAAPAGAAAKAPAAKGGEAKGKADAKKK